MSFSITAGGVTYTLPTPKYKIGYTKQSLELEAWRDEAGELHVVEARRKLRRVDMEWSYLTATQMQLIENAVKSEKFFTFNFYDYTAGDLTSMTAYSGDITYTLYSLRNGVGEYTDVKVPIIER